MSGWFGTSNQEVDSVFNGIEAGYARRRNAQRQRYSPMGSRHTHDARRGGASRSNRAAATTPATETQSYLGYTLSIRYSNGRWQTSASGRAGSKSFSGTSKGQSINNAKNWVDSKVVTKIAPTATTAVDPSIQRAVKAAEQKATKVAAKQVKADTDAVKKAAFREASAASASANRKAKDPTLTDAQKKAAFRQAEAASTRAAQQVKAAQASEAARFARVKAAQEQKILNQEMAKRHTFTESSAQSVVKAMTPSTDSGEVARFNREKARQDAARAFNPIPMPADFTAGSYTVRAAYNPRLQNYVVNVFQGEVNKEKKTFSKNEGAAASGQHMQWKSLVSKKAKYDAQDSRIFTQGGQTVELVVTKSASLSGMLDSALAFLGLGRPVPSMMSERDPRRKEMITRMDQEAARRRQGAGGKKKKAMFPVDRSIRQRMAEKERQIAQQGQERSRVMPQNIRSRTQAMDRKVKEFDQVVSKPAVSTPPVVSKWSSMPTKSFAVKINGQSTPYDSYEAATAAYNGAVEAVKSAPVVDASISERIRQAQSQDGSGGAITDAAAQAEKIQQFKEASEASIPTAVIEETPLTQVMEQVAPQTSENYDEMVQTQEEKLDHFHQASRDSVPTVYPQPVSTYQAMTVQENQWVQAEAQAAKNTDKLLDQQQLLGVGILALAGAMYYSRK